MHRMHRTYRILLVGLTVVLGFMADSGAAQQVPRDRQVQIVAEGMCCKGCARKVTGQLYAARGVKDVSVNLQSRTLSVTLPQRGGATLAGLWQAVEQGDGAPSKLITTAATYTLTPPAMSNETGQPVSTANAPLRIVIDNLHCVGCAKKIAAQLYTLKGVTKVSVDLQNDTLIVETNPGTFLSPWLVIDAVARSKERPVAVHGTHGTLSIVWTMARAPKTNHQY